MNDKLLVRIIHLLLSKELVDRYKASFVGDEEKFLFVNTFELSNFGYNCSGELQFHPGALNERNSEKSLILNDTYDLETKVNTIFQPLS